MKKKLCFLLSILALLAVTLSACGSSSSNEESTNESASTSGGALSKAAWVGMLGDKFGYDAYESTENIFSDVDSSNAYYDEIQSCAEWQILTETSEFLPDAGITWLYAIETSVRAIGIDKLNKSDVGEVVSEDNLVEFFTTHIANVDESTLSADLSETDAETILNYAYAYAMNLTLVQSVEYTCNEGVYETDAENITLSIDGETATINDGSSYSEGDVIYVHPSDENAAYAVRVTSVDDDTITYEEAGMEDVFEELQVTGTYEGSIINVEAAEGVDITIAMAPDEDGVTYINYVETDGSFVTLGMKADGDSVTYTYSSDGVTFTAGISGITGTADVDYSLLGGLKIADITVSFDDKIALEYKKDFFSKTVNLGSVDVALGTTPLSLKISLAAKIGLNGEVSLTYTSTVVANMNYQKDKGFSKSVNNNDPYCDFHAEVTLTVEPTIKAEACCLGYGIANVKVKSGVVGIAEVDVDLLGNEPTCIDLNAYVPLKWAVNEDGCLVTTINNKWKSSGTVWDSESSPIKLHYHWEDAVLVDECTRGSGEEVVAETVDEDGNPYDEYAAFDFEEIVFGTIRVATYRYSMFQSDSVKIGVLEVPDGYSTSDLVYSSDNTSVCSVSGNTVTATGTGTTLVRITTSDGKFTVSIGITVMEDYNDTSGFVPIT